MTSVAPGPAAVAAWLAHCRPLLPVQNPLWAFVHNNLLLQWEERPFASAVRAAAALYRATPYESEAFYRAELQRGRIGAATLGAVLLARWPSDRPRPPSPAAAVAAFLADPDCGDDVPPTPLVPGPTAEHLIRYSVRDRPLQDWLVPMVASYLDQGMAPWPNPYAAEGLWAFFTAEVAAMPDSGMPWRSALRALRARLAAHRAAGRDLDAIVAAEVAEFAPAGGEADYCLQALFVLKGWSGMVARLEAEPALAPAEPPRVGLRDWLAILLVSIHALDDAAGTRWPRHPQPVSHHTRGLGRRQRWQEAYERSFAGLLLAQLERDRRTPAAPAACRAQVLVCMDDREESLRRALEAVDPAIATYGVVGSFHLDMRFHALGAGRPTRQCPPVVEPTRTIREVPVDAAGAAWSRARAAGRLRASLALQLFFHSRTLVRGFLVALAAGLLSFVPLVLKLLLPGHVHRWRRQLQRWTLPRPPARILIDGPDGYSPEEQARIVGGLLRTCGLVDGFAPLVAVVSHGATTSNNPLRQAYGCGACSGNPGHPNARTFALLANREAVRDLLAAAGLAIPAATRFVPFHHDTTTDQIELLDAELLPAARRAEVEALRRDLRAAAGRNAVERCRRLLPHARHLDAARATQHVQDRGHDLAQPRPEYGHNRVAACIVGRRAITAGTDLDRRCFLVSYDPTRDPTGAALRDAVLGTVPVAVNIAMDYYFSRVDNDGFGAGSKLPLNVTSLLGVITGSKSDLRLGLARQQVELHEPMRILVLVEASAARLAALVGGHPRLQRLVAGDWLRLGRIDPDHGALELWQSGAFAPWRQVWPEFGHLAAGERPAVFDPRYDAVLEGLA